MSFPFICPHCGLATDVEEKYAGVIGPCAGCGAEVQIPEKKTNSRPTGDVRKNSSSLILISILVFGVIVFATASVMFIIWIATPAITNQRQIVQSNQCVNNLRAIANAMNAYHDDHGHYPPPYSIDENGKPLLSWRVHLLPYLGSEAKMVYQRFNVKAAWNSPENAWAALEIPSVYSCPTDPDLTLGTTSYMVVVGKGMIFSTDKEVTRDDVEKADGLSETILVVEVAGSAVNWAEPVDITPEKIAQGINSGVAGGPSSRHPDGGTHVLFADGKIRYMPYHTSPTELQGMCTCNGKEVVAIE